MMSTARLTGTSSIRGYDLLLYMNARCRPVSEATIETRSVYVALIGFPTLLRSALLCRNMCAYHHSAATLS
jgi:hypothetical protein